MVAGLDLGFQPVEPQFLEGVAQHQGEAFGHVPLAGAGGEGRVGEGAVLEASADDAVDVDGAGDGTGLPHVDQQAFGGQRVVEPREVGLELLRCGGQ